MTPAFPSATAVVGVVSLPYRRRPATPPLRQRRRRRDRTRSSLGGPVATPRNRRDLAVKPSDRSD
eukprot:905926-Prymnesium_polylepis.1